MNKGKNDILIDSLCISAAGRTEEIKGAIRSRGGKGGRGWNDWASHAQVKAKGLLDGVLEIKINFKVTSQGENPVQPSTVEPLVLKNAFDNIQAASFALFVEGEEIKVHRFVIANASEYFKNCIQDNKNTSYITFDCCSAEVARVFVKFIYTNKVGTKRSETLKSLLKLADRYLVTDLKSSVEKLMIKKLVRENMVDFFIAGILCDMRFINSLINTLFRTQVQCC